MPESPRAQKQLAYQSIAPNKQSEPNLQPMSQIMMPRQKTRNWHAKFKKNLNLVRAPNL